MSKYVKVLVRKKGWKWSAESRKRGSEAQKKRKRPPMSEQGKRNISESLKGKKFSLETRKKISEAKIKDKVGYGAIHDWVRRWKGTPKRCENCGVEGKYMNWANIDHKYKRVLEDYTRLCVPCHRTYDKKFTIPR